MDDSLKRGLMAVFAVSATVVFLAVHAHKRLLSDFINKMEAEIESSAGAVKHETKKKVRFADDVAKSTARKAYGKNQPSLAIRNIEENFEAMPQNWQVLYKGILQNRRVTNS